MPRRLLDPHSAASELHPVKQRMRGHPWGVRLLNLSSNCEWVWAHGDPTDHPLSVGRRSKACFLTSALVEPGGLCWFAPLQSCPGMSFRACCWLVDAPPQAKQRTDPDRGRHANQGERQSVLLRPTPCPDTVTLRSSVDRSPGLSRAVVAASACAHALLPTPSCSPGPSGGTAQRVRGAGGRPTGDSSESTTDRGSPVDPSSPNRGAYVGHDW